MKFLSPQLGSDLSLKVYRYENIGSHIIMLRRCFLVLCLCMILITRPQTTLAGKLTNEPGVREAAATLEIFRFNISSEPESLDPIASTSSIANYMLNVLYTPLMRYQEHKLSPYGAKECKALSVTHYKCILRKDWKWSDGQPVTADQFLSNWQHMKTSSSPRLNQFSHIKEVKVISANVIEFTLSRPDSEFLYRLIDPAFSPRRDEVQSRMQEGTLTTGPYFVKNRVPGRSYFLSVNPYFFIANVNRPNAEAIVVENEHTAIALLETHELNFVRRIPADQTAVYKDKPGFMQVPLHRIDYIGINADVAKDQKLRENLIYSIQPLFQTFKKMFFALGPPGCMGLITQESQKQVCYERRTVTPYTDAERANLPHLKLMFATQGGDDIRRAMELFHSGWKKNLNLDLELLPTEFGVMSALLKENPPPLFRRGVPLERPTCLAALEIFESQSPDNFVRINDKAYDGTIKKMREGKGSLKALCQKGLEQLLAMHRIIPMGQLHYTMLSDNKFDGILINELNQIDLSRLKPKAAREKHR